MPNMYPVCSEGSVHAKVMCATYHFKEKIINHQNIFLLNCLIKINQTKLSDKLNSKSYFVLSQMLSEKQSNEKA